MVFRGRLDGAEAAASLKNTSVSLAVGPGFVVAWDLGGRLYSVFRGGHTFRRGLSGGFLHKWRDAAAVPDAAGPYDERQRVRLGEDEGDRLLDECAALAARARHEIEGHADAWRDEQGRPAGRELIEALAACARFDAAAARDDSVRFAQVYSPIGILPPDQYMSVVLQATAGCSFGTCTFCGFYREPAKPKTRGHDGAEAPPYYRVKTAAEFARHVADVREYLGASLSLRRQSVFLGSANALAVPLPRLAELFGLVRAGFADGLPTPVHAFVDAFTGSLKDPAAYARLKELGLRRVYVGLESGHDPLLAFVRKPGTSGQALETVRAIRSAGVPVAVIVMIGLGGSRFAEGHVADTVSALNAMRLGAGDLVYFSDLVEVPGTPYPVLARDADVRPLSLTQRIAQLRAIRTALVFPASPPKFARYDIREFVY